MKNYSKLWIVVVLLIFITGIKTVNAEDTIIVDFYYSESCGSCKAYIPIIDDIENNENYTGKIVVNRKEVGSNAENKQEWSDHGFSYYPSVVVNGEVKVPKENITKENLENIINEYITKINGNNLDISLLEQILTVGLLFVVIVVIGLLSLLAWRKDKEK